MGVMILTLPRLGETMEEARVTDWLVAPGAAFKRGEVLLEVETDKTVVEVPAMQDGVLIAQLVKTGDMVALDAAIAEVEVTCATTADEAPPSPPSPLQDGEGGDNGTTAPPSPLRRGDGGEVSGQHRASPVARRLARDAGLDLTRIAGTGRHGRVTGDDVRSLGTQATVVFLHGLHDHAGGWRGLPERLGQPVAVLDLPGHGDSGETAQDVAGAVDALLPLIPAGRVRLVGHSVGAVLAVRLALRLGPRVEAVVLLAPAGLGLRINGDFLDVMAAADTPEALARGLAMLGAGPVSGAVMAQELARLRRQRGATSAFAASVANGGMQQLDIAPDVARLACPVTAIFGVEDRIIDWRDCANLPATTAIHLVPGAGHLPHLAAPALVARLITGTAVQGGAPQGSD